MSEAVAHRSSDARDAAALTKATARAAHKLGLKNRTLAAVLGHDFVAHNVEIWERMIPVLDSGEHCPTHLRARKPA